jgi:hypothetical protein
MPLWLHLQNFSYSCERTWQQCSSGGSASFKRNWWRAGYFMAVALSTVHRSASRVVKLAAMLLLLLLLICAGVAVAGEPAGGAGLQG